MARFKVQLFGGLAVIGDDFEIRQFPTKRSANILARLALSRNGSISRDELAELLWPEDYLDTTRVRLRSELTRLRTALGPAKDIVTSDKTWVRLDRTVATVDVDEFERLSAVRVRAIEVYDGQLLPEINEPWVFGPRIDLQARFESIALSEAHDCVERGEPERAREIARRALGINPSNPHFSTFLVGELTVPRMEMEFQPDRPPLFFDRFHGREREAADLRRLMSDSSGPRVLTLIGPGGAGKTRLASEISRPAETAFLSLESIAADAFAVRLVDAVARNKGGFVVIDNAEIAVEAVARAVSEVLRAYPQSRFLITSRQKLEIPGERLFPIESLADLDEIDSVETARGNHCVTLLLDRIQAAEPDFALTEGNWRDIKQLLLRLDGLPLAIELAASSVTIHGLTAVVRRIADRFELLVSTRIDVPDRQRSLLAAIETSVEALDDAQRSALATLSVCAGSFSSDFAAKLLEGADLGPILEQLRDRSLLSRQHDRFGARYRMLDSIRAYARPLLADDMRDLLLRRMVEILRAEWSLAMSVRHTPEESEAIERIQPDKENLLASIEWSTYADPDLAASLVAESWWFFACIGGSADGMRLGPKIIAGLSERTPARTRSRLEFGLAHMANCHGDYAYARQGFARAYEAEADPTSEFSTWCLLNQAAIVHEQGDYAAMRDLCVQANSCLTEDSTDYIRSVSKATDALSRGLTGLKESVISDMEAALATRISLGYHHEVCRGYVDLSYLARELGDLELARISGNRACDLVTQSITNATDELWAFLYRASLAVEERDLESLEVCLSEAGLRHRRIGSQRDFLELRTLEAESEILRENLARAREIALHALSRSIELGITPAIIDTILLAIEILRHSKPQLASHLASALLCSSQADAIRPSRRRRVEQFDAGAEAGLPLKNIATKALAML